MSKKNRKLAVATCIRFLAAFVSIAMVIVAFITLLPNSRENYEPTIELMDQMPWAPQASGDTDPSALVSDGTSAHGTTSDSLDGKGIGNAAVSTHSLGEPNNDRMSALATSDYPTEIVNGDFQYWEGLPEPNGKWAYISIDAGNYLMCEANELVDLPAVFKKEKFGWRSTQDSNISIFYVPGAVQIDNGHTFANGEINRTADLVTSQYGKTIYQDISTTVGSVYRWQLKHAATQPGSTDKMAVMIGSQTEQTPQLACRLKSPTDPTAPIGNIGTSIQTTFKDDGTTTDKWDVYTGAYKAKTDVTRFTFADLNGKTSTNNHVDDITFTIADPLYYNLNATDAIGTYPSPDDVDEEKNGYPSYHQRNTDIALSDVKPVRNGYTFLGWSDVRRADVLNAADAEAAGASHTHKMHAGENVIYAVWAKNPIIEVRDPLNFNAIVSTYSVPFNSAFDASKLPVAPEHAGYAFSHYDSIPTSNVTENVIVNVAYNRVIDGDASLTWKGEKPNGGGGITVNLVRQDGDNDGDDGKGDVSFVLNEASGYTADFSYKVDINADNEFPYEVQLNNAPEGYEFSYDVVCSNGHVTLTLTATRSTTVKIPITKIWQDNENADRQRPESVLLMFTTPKTTLNYDANGGENAPEGETKYHSDPQFTVKGQEGMSRSGYALAGWSDSADDSVARYAPGDVISFDGESKTLYAVWKEVHAFAVYSDRNYGGDGSLRFYKRETIPREWDFYEGRVATNIYTQNVEEETYQSGTIPWYSIREKVESVSFEDEFIPRSTAAWFDHFTTCTSMNLKKLNTSRCINMSNMFSSVYCMDTIDMQHFDTSKVTDMHDIFLYATGLKSLDLSSFDFGNVTNMYRMFENCYALESITFPKEINTSSLTTMEHMFTSCRSLKRLDLSQFDTSNVTKMNSAFSWCWKLEYLNVSSFDTSNVAYISSMFCGCYELGELDVTSFDTSKVTSMEGMFNYCKVTTLDLSSFDTSKVTNMHGMFSTCKELTTVYVSERWSTDAVTDSGDMFYGCEKIVGENGTKFNNYAGAAATDKTYARIDGGTDGTFGYFTYKAAPVPHAVNTMSAQTQSESSIVFDVFGVQNVMSEANLVKPASAPFAVSQSTRNNTQEISSTTTISISSSDAIDRSTWNKVVELPGTDPKTGEPIEYNFIGEIDEIDGYTCILQESIAALAADTATVSGYILVNAKTQDVDIEKRWVGTERELPDECTISLSDARLSGSKNGDVDDELVYSATLEKNDNVGTTWHATIEDVPVYDGDGDIIPYQINEDDVDGWTMVHASGNACDGYVVVNSTCKSVTIDKMWNDDMDGDGQGDDKGIRPDSILVALYDKGDGAFSWDDWWHPSSDDDTDEYNSPECVTWLYGDDDEDDIWQYVFDDVPLYDKNGKKIDYALDEDSIFGYAMTSVEGSVDEGRIGIVNSYTHGDVVVSKVWDDEGYTSLRPETLSLALVPDGEYPEYVEAPTVEVEMLAMGMDSTSEAMDAGAPAISERSIEMSAAKEGANVDVVEGADGKDVWSLTLYDVAIYAQDGTPITYKLVESEVPHGYDMVGYNCTQIADMKVASITNRAWERFALPMVGLDGIDVRLLMLGAVVLTASWAGLMFRNRRMKDFRKQQRGV